MSDDEDAAISGFLHFDEFFVDEMMTFVTCEDAESLQTRKLWNSIRGRLRPISVTLLIPICRISRDLSLQSLHVFASFGSRLRNVDIMAKVVLSLRNQRGHRSS